MRKLWSCSVCVLFFALAGTTASSRAAPTQYELIQWTLAPRAATSGGSYTLWSIAGQPEAGRIDGGNYVLSGGFRLRAGPLTGYQIYLPFIVK
jgi:hypothetical protein